MSDGGEVIFSDDYTKLFNHRSRQWTVGDLSFAWCGGLTWDVGGTALRKSIAPSVAIVICLLLAGGRWPILALVLVPVTTVVVYFILNVKDPDATPLKTLRRGDGAMLGTTTAQRRALAAITRRTPTDLLGMSADTEPRVLEWSAVLYTPQERST